MTSTELKERTKKFAIETIKFVNTLPKTKSNEVISNQIIRSATSVAANYRASLRGRSTAEFISKLNIVLEEADESNFWLDLIGETTTVSNTDKLKELYRESNELTAIFAKSLITAKSHRANLKS